MVEIKFETDNAAFEEYPSSECVRILEKIIDTLKENFSSTSQISGSILDINGNRVGSYNFDFSTIDCNPDH